MVMYWAAQGGFSPRAVRETHLPAHRLRHRNGAILRACRPRSAPRVELQAIAATEADSIARNLQAFVRDARFHEFIAAEMIAECDRARPRLMSSEPARSAADVDPSLAHIVLRFDRPMVPRISISVGPAGHEHFPEVSGVHWDESGTTLTLDVKLKPAWSCELVRRTRSWLSEDPRRGTVPAPEPSH